MITQNEIFESDGINTVYQTIRKYSKSTVKGWRVIDQMTGEIEAVTVVELGENYIQVEGIASGFKLKVEYTVEGTLPGDDQAEYDLTERVVKLEKAVEALYEIVMAQKQSINNRLSVSSFRAWTKLIEKKMGIKLVDSNMGNISSELAKD